VSELYNEGSFPVGLIPEADYTSARLQLEPEDTLVLFSDGVTEAENPIMSFSRSGAEPGLWPAGRTFR
jgi:serine phosphatase RsbU (regulator of sigma subunit)